MGASSRPLHGVFVSLVTPFVEESVSKEALLGNLEALSRTPVRGFLVLGGNGEYMALSTEEQDAVLTAVLAYFRGSGRTVICGVAYESTYLTIERCKTVADLGGDTVRVLPPHYFASRMNDEILIRFYEEVAEAVSLPILLYNVPKLTGGVSLSPEAVTLLAEHPRIVGIKDSSEGGIYGYLSGTAGNESFDVIAGSITTFLPALLAGGVGADMSIANYLPGRCCELQGAFEAGDLERARRLHLSLTRINRLVSGDYGVPGVKAAMELMGFAGGAPRRPFVPLDSPGRGAVRRVLEEEGFLV